MKTHSLILVAVLLAVPAMAAEEAVQLKTATGTLYGTLIAPASTKPLPVVLIIAGSGPTDRNGNNRMLPGPNNSLKLLAEALGAHNIASLRYDKRGIGESKDAMTAEKELRLETYVDDAVAWVHQLSKAQRFSSVIIAGHSEGSLIGMLAAQKVPARGFVSLEGVGRPADAILRTQLAGKLPPELKEFNEKALTALKNGKTIDEVPPALTVLYRPSVQPYLISWFRYDPAAEIRKLTMPVLIVQGTTDIQVGVDDARALASGRPNAKLEIIEGMNHVLKTVAADPAKQVASYSDPTLPIVPRLVEAMTTFVDQLAARR